MLGRVLDDSYAPEVRRDLTAFATARMTSNACYRFVGPFIATIARGLDVKLADIGVAIAVSELFGLASPVIGHVVDRLGARRAVAVGLGAGIVGTCLAAASQGVAMLAVALVLLGQGNTTFYLGIGTWIAQHVPYERRGLGLLVGVDTVGRAMMSVPATRLYTSHGIGWPAAMTAILATIAVATIVVSAPRTLVNRQ